MTPQIKTNWQLYSPELDITFPIIDDKDRKKLRLIKILFLLSLSLVMK